MTEDISRAAPKRTFGEIFAPITSAYTSNTPSEWGIGRSIHFFSFSGIESLEGSRASCGRRHFMTHKSKARTSPIDAARPDVACYAAAFVPIAGVGTKMQIRNFRREGPVRYFLDAEFNGFGGQLISLALVPQDRDAAPFYAAIACVDPEPWTAQHVMPVLHTTPIERAVMTEKLADYLRSDPDPLIVANWPEDIAHLALLMVTSAGHRLAMPTIVFELLDLPLFDSESRSAIPHNACHDAAALRDYVLAIDH